MTEFEEVVLHPEESYAHPLDVVHDQSLTLPQKRRILEEWAYDAFEKQVADEENMVSNDATQLSRVHQALLMLDNGV